MRLSASDKYLQVYCLATQGAQNSVPSPNPQIEMWSTRNQCNFY